MAGHYNCLDLFAIRTTNKRPAIARVSLETATMAGAGSPLLKVGTGLIMVVQTFGNSIKVPMDGLGSA